jgi:urea transport system permease protein
MHWLEMKRFFTPVFLALSLLLPLLSYALTPQESFSLSSGETEDRLKALTQIIEHADSRAIVLIQALSDDSVKISDHQVYIVQGDKAIDPVTGEPLELPASAEDVVSNNRMRGELDAALASLSLFSPDQAVRLKAIKSMLKEPDAEKLPMLEKALKAEQVEALKNQLEFAKAAIEINSSDDAKRLAAVKILGGSKTPDTQRILNDRMGQESNAEIKNEIKKSLQAIQSALAWGEKLGILFTGLSLGSILLLVALGLAITYGLMGVINMAHGELMMVGAYATYVVQVFFRAHYPQWFDAYLLVAIPVSFLTSALVGAIIERVVLKFLYGRPLETLLATWGISLMLMQLVRSIFGAQNVGVENPAWMSGGIEVLANLILPWNRMLIIVFAGLVLLAMSLLIGRTRLGLFVRGVTQNRPMASCMGVNTARIDTYAFALGSGIAGLAGCALSQIGNVGPDLGQSYIVDSFMVVVLGGVGQLMGSVYAAIGLGVINKLLEGVAGAVLAKIAVLVFIIFFIQKRPQGLFAMKGRSAET